MEKIVHSSLLSQGTQRESLMLSWRQETEAFFHTSFYQQLLKRLLITLALIRGGELLMSLFATGLPPLLQGGVNSFKYGVVWLCLIEFALKIANHGSAFFTRKGGAPKREGLEMVCTLVAAFSSETAWILGRLLLRLLGRNKEMTSPETAESSPQAATTLQVPHTPGTKNLEVQTYEKPQILASRGFCWGLLTLGLALSYIFSLAGFALFGGQKVFLFATLERSIGTIGYLIKTAFWHPFLVGAPASFYKTLAVTPPVLSFCLFFCVVLSFLFLNTLLLAGFRLLERRYSR